MFSIATSKNNLGKTKWPDSFLFYNFEFGTTPSGARRVTPPSAQGQCGSSDYSMSTNIHPIP